MSPVAVACLTSHHHLVSSRLNPDISADHKHHHEHYNYSSSIGDHFRNHCQFNENLISSSICKYGFDHPIYVNKIPAIAPLTKSDEKLIKSTHDQNYMLNACNHHFDNNLRVTKIIDHNEHHLKDFCSNKKENTLRKNAENVLKLSMLSLIIFYTITWSYVNHLLQQWTFDNNVGHKNNTIKLSFSLSCHFYIPSVFELIVKENSIVCFLLILITVSLICEKLFGYHITIKTEDHWPDCYHHDGTISVHQSLMSKQCQICQNKTIVHTEIIISLICLLPWRFISKIWGFVNQVPLPIFVRRPLYLWYAQIFGCNLDEIENKDLSQYANLSQFFRRSLAPDIRPISQENGIVSPADGLVVQCEPVPNNGGYIGTPVKGIHYSINNFLGLNNVYQDFHENWSLNKEKIRPDHRLYSCVIYLAPGDYHRFHSPVDWTIHHRRHFSGNLLSVKPSFVAKIPNLFAINERVVYFGQWKYGLFSIAAVGATNVGTINVFFDQDLKTNQTYSNRNYRTEKTFKHLIHMNKGDLFGEFNLGSTLVLIYEAPVHHTYFELSVQQKVKYGQLLLRVEDD